MKLYQYLVEGREKEIDYDSHDEAYKKISKDCKYYLSLLKGKTPLYRGTDLKNWGSHSYYKKAVRQDRRPKGTTRNRTVFTNLVNKKLEEMGHVRRDKSVSATVDYTHAGIFTEGMGEIFYFFPIGKFSYSWIPTIDWNYSKGKWDTFIFSKMSYLLDNMDTDDTLEDEYKEAMEELRELFNMITTNKGFDTAYNNKFEMWFNPKEYYLVPTKTELGKMI